MPAHIHYRIIIRFSLDNDINSSIRNSTIRTLEGAGFYNTATGVWESRGMDITEIHRHFNSVFGDLARISVDPAQSTTLDHLWIYIDKANES